MRRFALAPLMTITVLFGTTQTVLATAKNYHPNTPGTTWTYSNGETQIVGKARQYKGVKVTPINHQYGNILITQDLVEYRPDGSVWLRGVNTSGKLSWYQKPLMIYPAGVMVPGASWKSVGGGIERVSQVTGSQGVRTKVGAYNALVIQTDTLVGNEVTTQLNYFVPTVGIVKIVTAEGAEVELVKR